YPPGSGNGSNQGGHGVGQREHHGRSKRRHAEAQLTKVRCNSYSKPRQAAALGGGFTCESARSDELAGPTGRTSVFRTIRRWRRFTSPSAATPAVAPSANLPPTLHCRSTARRSTKCGSP